MSQISEDIELGEITIPAPVYAARGQDPFPPPTYASATQTGSLQFLVPLPLYRPPPDPPSAIVRILGFILFWFLKHAPIIVLIIFLIVLISFVTAKFLGS